MTAVTNTADRYKHPWTSDERQFLVDTHASLTVAEQAAALGRPEQGVTRQRTHLSRAGKIRVEESAMLTKLWKPEEDDKIRDWIERGYSVRRIAKELRRSVSSIYDRVADYHGGVTKLRNGLLAVRTLKQTAELFGVPYQVATDWIRYGWLKAKRNAGKKPAKAHERHYYLITDEALITFIENRQTWPTWEPKWIADSDWRRVAEEARADAEGRWLTTKQIALQRGVSEECVCKWCRVYGLPAHQIGRRYYVWSTDLEAFLRRRNGFRSGLCTN